MGALQQAFGDDVGDIRAYQGGATTAALGALGAGAAARAGEVLLPSNPDPWTVAHEVSHAVAGGGASGVSTPGDRSEKAADTAADAFATGRDIPAMAGEAGSGAAIHRTPPDGGIVVNDPQAAIPEDYAGGEICATNGAVAQDYLQQMCPGGNVTVDPETGAVAMDPSMCVSRADATPQDQLCSDLCGMTQSPDQVGVNIDDVAWPHTRFDDRTAAADGTGTGSQIHVPSPNNPNNFGAAGQNGEMDVMAPWAVAAHELLGHAYLGENGVEEGENDPERGRGGHYKAVGRENLIREANGMTPRGDVNAPNCGESWSQPKDGSGPVQFGSYLDVCRDYREEINQSCGTNYTVESSVDPAACSSP